MITKNEAKRWTLDKEDKYWLIASIREHIYNAIANQKFHCDWYSPARYDMSDDEIKFVRDYMSDVESMGFVVREILYDRTEDFPNQRIKYHICWE